MKRIGKALRALGKIVRDPWLLNKVLDDNRPWHDRVRKSYNAGSFPVIDADKIFGTEPETIEPYAFMEGGSLPTDLMLLKKIARSFSSCTYFEIGTWRGESVANVARVAKECFTLDLPPAEIIESGKPQEYVDQHRMYSANLENVKHLEGHSATFDFSSVGGKFDLVFIDGDHHYESVLNDTKNVFSHLLHEGSVVVWHDYAFNPLEIRYEVMAAILDALPAEKHGRLYHFANSMCAFYYPDDLSGIARPLSLNPRLQFSLDIRY